MIVNSCCLFLHTTVRIFTPKFLQLQQLPVTLLQLQLPLGSIALALAVTRLKPTYCFTDCLVTVVTNRVSYKLHVLLLVHFCCTCTHVLLICRSNINSTFNQALAGYICDKSVDYGVI